MRRGLVLDVKPIDELIKSIPKIISEYKKVHLEITQANKVFIGKECAYLSENILNLKNLDKTKYRQSEGSTFARRTSTHLATLLTVDGASMK